MKGNHDGGELEASSQTFVNLGIVDFEGSGKIPYEPKGAAGPSSTSAKRETVLGTNQIRTLLAAARIHGVNMDLPWWTEEHSCTWESCKHVFKFVAGTKQNDLVSEIRDHLRGAHSVGKVEKDAKITCKFANCPGGGSRKPKSKSGQEQALPYESADITTLVKHYLTVERHLDFSIICHGCGSKALREDSLERHWRSSCQQIGRLLASLEN